MDKIERLYAFVSEDATGEGLMAYSATINGVPTMLPLVGADMARVESLVPIALKIAMATGKPFRILRFDSMTDITREFV